jgi:predicted ATPase
VHILATSREPLRAQGERLMRLAPLAAPRASSVLNAGEAMTYPAIQLFVEHAMASQHTFELKDDDVAPVADICRRLDGLPLAIELAATHVGLFGVRGLVAHLDDLLNLLTLGRRTASPRQQSLRATLEWSFNLLSSIEREALRRLSVFTDSFDLEAARSVIVDDGIVAGDVLDIVSNLTAKSLIVADDHGAGQFRLLTTARTYAREEARGQ